MIGLYLADKSAYEQRRHSHLAREIFRLLTTNGTLATCEIVVLELLYSARNLADYTQLRSDLEAQPSLATTTSALRKAIDIQHELARRGQHRLPLPDLMIAATAHEHGAVLLHYDSDFDQIAKVTGQPTEWIVPRGTAG